ncbi:MAG: SGNH/GDSL hydrolase family protein [Anaerolineae bacterium]|nr:SGNH/GDSL hydrolase family protein [Anaerolineae bacterium]
MGPPPTAASLPGTADLAPVFPDLSDPRIGQLFQAGAAAGNLPYTFAHIGGLPLAQTEVIRAFAPGKSYNLASQGDLQAVIDWFNQMLGDGTTSFSRSSVASTFDWTVIDLLDPSRANPSACAPGETPLDCELRMTQPVLVFVSVGFNDALRGMDLGTFEAQLRQVVATVAGRGVVPVLLSLPRSNVVDVTVAQGFNEAIFRVAQESGAPVLNVWRLLSEVPGFGSNGEMLSVSPSGEGDLDPSATGNFGVNALNNALLRFLSEFRAIVLTGL